MASPNEQTIWLTIEPIVPKYISKILTNNQMYQREVHSLLNTWMEPEPFCEQLSKTSNEDIWANKIKMLHFSL